MAVEASHNTVHPVSAILNVYNDMVHCLAEPLFGGHLLVCSTSVSEAHLPLRCTSVLCVPASQLLLLFIFQRRQVVFCIALLLPLCWDHMQMLVITPGTIDG